MFYAPNLKKSVVFVVLELLMKLNKMYCRNIFLLGLTSRHKAFSGVLSVQANGLGTLRTGLTRTRHGGEKEKEDRAV